MLPSMTFKVIFQFIKNIYIYIPTDTGYSVKTKKRRCSLKKKTRDFNIIQSTLIYYKAHFVYRLIGVICF